MPRISNKKNIRLVDYITKNQEALYRLAYSYVKNQHEALDVVQESIYKALSSIDTLKNSDYMKTWMYRIVINTSISHIRKNKPTFASTEIIENCQEEAKDIAQNMDLYYAIDKLSEKHKTVVVLRYFEDMKLEEIAKVTDCNINTVKTRLYSAIEKLKAIIEGEV